MSKIDLSKFEKEFAIKEEMRGNFHEKLFEIIDAKGLSNPILSEDEDVDMDI